MTENRVQYTTARNTNGTKKTASCSRSNKQTERYMRGKIRLIEGNEKYRHPKKLSYNGTLQQVFICLRPRLLSDFCLGQSSNFVGSESGQIQSVKQNSCRIWSPTEPHTFPTLNTVCCKYVQYTYSHRDGGGRVEPERRGEGNRGEYRSQSWVENTNMTECMQKIGYLQSIISDIHLPQSPFTGKFFQMATFCIDFLCLIFFGYMPHGNELSKKGPPELIQHFL